MILIKTFFSFDLRKFEKLNETNDAHYGGRLEIFNGELMAIAGEETRAVEIRKNGQWEHIDPVGNTVRNKRQKLSWFSSLTIPGNTSDILFVFGI